MIDDIIKKCREYAVIGASAALLTFSPINAYAANIFNGMRGPTPWQLDYRMLFSENEEGEESLNQFFILKYWDGKELGKWCFIGVPYLNSNAKKDLGPISVGGGPRGKVGNLEWLSFGGIMFSGDSKIDQRLGLYATYLTDKDIELTGTFEYRFKDEKPDEIRFGSVAGGKIADKVRVVGGFNSLKRDGDYSINLRALLRYTHSKRFHVEAVGEQGIKSENIPKGTSVGFYVRYNF